MYYDERSERLFVADDQVLMYPRVPGQALRSASWQFGNPSLVEKVPESAARATVEGCLSVIVLTGWAETVNPKASS